MRASFQQNLPALPLERMERPGDPDLQNLETDLSLDDAKALVGAAVHRAITRSGRPYKRFGDPAQVLRWCKHLETPNTARLCTDPETFREFVIALAEACPGVDVRVGISVLRRSRS